MVIDLTATQRGLTTELLHGTTGNLVVQRVEDRSSLPWGLKYGDINSDEQKDRGKNPQIHKVRQIAISMNDCMDKWTTQHENE